MFRSRLVTTASRSAPHMLLLGLLCGLALSASASAAPHAHETTAETRSVLSLDVHASGDTIDVLTGEKNGTRSAASLWHRRSADGGKSWSPPVRIDAGLPPPHHPHRGNDPQVASSGRTVLAVWGSAGRGFRDSGAMVTAVSRDGGKTWRRETNPADDNRYDGHGYSDLAARGGRFHLTWLDSRSGTQGVRYARTDDEGLSWSRNVSVKTSTCECCWNKMLLGSSERVFILYRDNTPRDMGLAVSRDDGNTWTLPGKVGAFDWQIQSCPHTGGALAATGRESRQQLHALVWTGKAQARGLHFLTSSDRGANWLPVARMGGEYAQRADLAARGEELLAVWDEPVKDRGSVFFSRSANAGKSWSPSRRVSGDQAQATYPRAVATRSGWLIVWTEMPDGGESRLRMVVVN